eukprot:g3622.t1
MAAKSLFVALSSGDWKLARLVVAGADAASLSNASGLPLSLSAAAEGRDTLASVNGSANWKEHNSPLQLLYRESGEMQMGSKRSQISREYLYVRHENVMTSVDVHFHGPVDHLKLFHKLNVVKLDSNDNDLVLEGISTVHECGDDIYNGRLVVVSPSCIETRWAVTGPQKNYSILTRYSR